MGRHHADEEASQLADLAGLAIAAAALIPSRLVRGGPNLCLVRRATGLPCPTCGITRSWNAAARFQLRASLGYHPLGPLTLALALVAATADTRRQAPRWLGSNAVRGALVFGWLAVWFGRLAWAARGQSRGSIRSRPR